MGVWPRAVGGLTLQWVGNACESRTQNRLLSVAALYHGDRSRRAPKVLQREGDRGTGERGESLSPNYIERERGGERGSWSGKVTKVSPDNADLMGMLSESIIFGGGGRSSVNNSRHPRGFNLIFY